MEKIDEVDTILKHLKDKTLYEDEYYKLLDKGKCKKVNKKVLNDIINEIIEHIVDNKYKPKPVTLIQIPKNNGKYRIIGYTNFLRDRLLMRVLNNIFHMIYEPQFIKNSFAYRKGKGGRKSVSKQLCDKLNEYKYVMKIDIDSFFDNINHNILLSKLEIEDKKILNLLKSFLEIERVWKDTGKKLNNNKGIVQGLPISPMFSNIYLNEFDHIITKYITKYRKDNKLNVKYYRYADDILLASINKNEIYEIKSLIEKELSTLKLNLSKEKLVFYDFHQGEEVKFLGYIFRKVKNPNWCKNSKDKYWSIDIKPDVKAIEKRIFNKITDYHTELKDKKIDENKIKIMLIDKICLILEGTMKSYNNTGKEGLKTLIPVFDKVNLWIKENIKFDREKKILFTVFNNLYDFNKVNFTDTILRNYIYYHSQYQSIINNYKKDRTKTNEESITEETIIVESNIDLDTLLFWIVEKNEDYKKIGLVKPDFLIGIEEVLLALIKSLERKNKDKKTFEKLIKNIMILRGLWWICIVNIELIYTLRNYNDDNWNGAYAYKNPVSENEKELISLELRKIYEISRINNANNYKFAIKTAKKCRNIINNILFKLIEKRYANNCNCVEIYENINFLGFLGFHF
ncbi:MAG: reverse transcriptase/maturase family protein [Spirochaetota bacterium]